MSRDRMAIGAAVLLLALSGSAAAAVVAADGGVAGGSPASVDGPGDVAHASQPNCGFPYETTDATGTELRLPTEPERVVTLNPSAAQTMWEIGARGKVVGLTKYAGYLGGAGSRTNVSGATDIVVVEQVVALEPDLVLAPNATSTETVEQLRGANVTVYHFPEAREVEDVYAKTRTIGRLTGDCAGAEATVQEMQARIGAVRSAVDGEPRPDVLYAFFGYTAGRGTFIHALVEAAGGNNVAADYNVTGYRKLNPEVVVEADPDWIVRTTNDPEMPEGAPFNGTTAVMEGQVVLIPVEHFNQPAPRVVLAIEQMARHFHPEAYATADATSTATVTSTPEPPTPTATTGATATGTPGQPGFGVATATLAVAFALLATRLRR